MLNPILYLTVELKHREFESRLLLGLHAVKAGYSVLVGQQWSIFHNIRSLPPGAVLYKTVNKIQAVSMSRFRALGHVVTAADEEVLLCTEDACFTGGVCQEAVDNWDLFFAQSETHKNAIAKLFPAAYDKTIVTGNARIDLMGKNGLRAYEVEAAKVKKKVGPYILFNTNFSAINSIWGSVQSVAQINVQAGGMDPKDKASMQAFGGFIDWEAKNRAELITLMMWMADNINTHTIIVRPHPGENISFWTDLFGNHPRIRIVPRSNHIPWIMAADLVVHSNCTTGLEAALAGIPVFNLAPNRDPVWASRMTDLVNPTLRSWKEAAAATQEFLAHGTGVIAQRKEIEDHLDEYFAGHREAHAAQVMAEHMMRLLREKGVEPNPQYKWQPLPEIPFDPVNRAQPLHEKMSASVEEVTDSLRRLIPIVGLTKKIALTPVDDSLFLIQPNSP